MVSFKSGKKTKAALPISKHPLFPAMVALWFAALFGLGSLAIRPTLLEQFVLALRLDLVVPAAAPPLGFTSRILLALMMFVIGAAVGLIVARKVGGSGAERGQFRPARASATSFKASAADDEGFDRLDAARPATSHQIPGRRRALAMEEDYTNDFRDHAPVPGNVLHGHEPQILDLATLGGLSEYIGHDEPVHAEPGIETQPMQTAAQEPNFDPWHRHMPEDIVADAHEEEAPASADEGVSEHIDRPFDTPAEPVRLSEALPSGQPMDFHRPAFAAPVDHTPEVPPMEPIEQQIAAENITNAQPPRAFDPTPAAAPIHEVTIEPTIPQAALTVGLGLMPRDAVEKLTSAPLASLGVVQLAERLALAIARRKAPGEDAPAPVLSPAPALSPEFAMPVAFQSTPTAVQQPETFVSITEPEPEPQLEPAAVAPALPVEPVRESTLEPVQPTAIPRSMRPLSWDDDDSDDEEALPSILPPRRFAMAAPAAVDVAPVAEEPAPAPEPVRVTVPLM